MLSFVSDATQSSSGNEILFTKEDNLDINDYTNADCFGGFKIDILHLAISCLQEGIQLYGEVKKHEAVARSSAETEYKGMTKAICKLLWIRNLMQDLHIKQVSPMKLYCDNKTTCYIAHNLVQHDQTKHVSMIKMLA